MSKQEYGPGELLEMSGYYWKTCTLHAGVKLDVFTVVGKEALTGNEIAKRLRGDQRGVITLLNALTALNLLEKEGDVFSNTPWSYNFLSKDSHRYLGYMILHHHHLVESWSKLDRAVTSGARVRGSAAHEDEWREAFLMGMFNMAMAMAPEISALIDLSQRRHLLDLGGGPGTYAIHFCKENPELKATVYDLPTTRPFAEKTVEKFGLSGRIDFQEGDYNTQEIRGSYDAVWISHILHAEGPGECQKIIDKAGGALASGGIMLVHDFYLDETKASPLFPSIFSLNMLQGTEKGRAYADKEVGDMMKKAGLREVRRLDFAGKNDSGIMAGIK